MKNAEVIAFTEKVKDYMKNYDNSFPDLVKRSRESKEISQEQLAEIVDVTSRTIIRLESVPVNGAVPYYRKIKYETLEKICFVLQIEIPK